jgi:HSP20 family protein
MSTYMIIGQSPASDLEETQDHYLLSFEMPGVSRDRIQIETREDVLSVSGEGRRGRFVRSFTLPTGVDPAKIEAHSEDGILQLYIPKAEQSKPRQIKIPQGPSEFFAKLLSKKVDS